MTTAKKIDPKVPEMENPGDKPTEEKEIPLWKKKKFSREKLLRAIKAKSFSDTFRKVIRSEIKKDIKDNDE